jgi:hypothetical protein
LRGHHQRAGRGGVAAGAEGRRAVGRHQNPAGAGADEEEDREDMGPVAAVGAQQAEKSDAGGQGEQAGTE